MTYLAKTKKPSQPQTGSALLEALFAMLIFSIGLLALIGLQSVSIKNSIDAKYRADAALLINQIIAQMWVDRSNIDNYGHYQTGAVCSFTGSASANVSPWNTPVTAWLAQVSLALPGSAVNTTQILVSNSGSTKQVSVTVCWKGPQETTSHNQVATAQINP
jgi:type IV pilus assembly protein PilV